MGLLAESFRQALSVGNIKGSAEGVGSAFASLDFIAPTIFDIRKARQLTERLYQPYSTWASGMWGGSFDGVREILKGVPELVKSFGAPRCMEDGDRCWSWWEFVVFDGARWHSFHLEEDLSIKLDLSLQESEREGGADLRRVIVEEFLKAAAQLKLSN